jgi:hypothetical protein
MVVVMVLTAAPLSGFVGLELNFDWLNFDWLDFNTKASAESYSGTCGDNLTWSLDTETGELIISGTGAMTDYGYSTIIGGSYSPATPWKFYLSSIKTVTIPEGVTSIGNYAFSKCENITSIKIPERVTSIGNGAFKDCIGLTSIEIPDSVITIGKEAFRSCVNIASVKFGKKITTIKDLAFNGCSNLVEVIIPDSVTSIGNRSFSGNENLVNAIIGNGVVNIGEGAFQECVALKNITLGKNIKIIGIQAFDACKSLTKLELPFGVTTIGSLAFFYCEKLESINIPSSVTDIGTSAFSHCYSLTGNINIPDGIASIKAYTFWECWKITSIKIPDSVTNIESSAFQDCNSLTSITVPDSVTSIGKDAFDHCDNLLSVTIGNNVTDIGDYAFDFCPRLKNVTIPDSVINLGNYAFRQCQDLESVTIGKNVTCIGEGTFNQCYDLTSITIPNSIKSIGREAFKDCSSLTNVKIGKGVESIGYAAFRGCDEITDVEYAGSEEAWKKITIGTYNGCLTGAEINYYGASIGYDRTFTTFSNEVIVCTLGEKSLVLEPDSKKGSRDFYKFLGSTTMVTDTRTLKNSILSSTFRLSADEAKDTSARIYVSDYRDYVIPQEVMESWSTQCNIGVENSASGYEHNAYMQKDRKDGKAYVSTVFGRKAAYGGYKELKTEELKVRPGAEYDVIISLGGTEKSEVYTYYISQDNKRQIQNKTGIFSGIVLADVFERGKTIYAYAKSESGVITELQEIKLNLDSGTDSDWIEDWQNSTKLNVFGKDFTKITIPSSVPVIGDTEISFEAFKLPAGFEYDGDSLKISIGANIFNAKTELEANSPTKYKKWSQECFTDWKGLVKTTTEASNKTMNDHNETMDEYKNAINQFKKRWGTFGQRDKSKNWDLDALGYIDIAIVNGEYVVKEALISLEGKFTYKFTVQGAVLFIPGYFYIEAGAAFGVNSKGVRAIPDNDIPFEWDLTLKLEPEVTVGGGAGISDVISAGFYAKATLPIHATVTQRHLTIDLIGEAGIEAQAWVIKGKKKLFSGTYHVVDTYFDKRARFVTQSNPITGKEETYIITYEVVDRDYLNNTSQWFGDNIKFDTMALSQGGMNLETLQSSVFSSAKPQVISFGDKMLMSWIEDDSTRDEYNRMRLMYSVYDGVMWSEPKAVYDDGCNDNEPVIVTDGEDVYFAWQKLNKVLTEETALDINSIIENCEIYVAKYDSSEDTIVGVKQVTDNSVYDYAHNVSFINGTPYVYWATCNDNNTESGTDNTLKKATFEGTTSVIKSDLNYILDIDAAYINGKENLSYSMDADGNTLTAEDVNVFTNVDGTSTAFDKQNNAAYTIAFYGNFNGEPTLFVSDMTNIYYVEDGEVKTVLENEGAVLNNINYVDNNGEGILLWTQNNESGNDVYSSAFENGSWTTPIVVSNKETTLLTSIDATMYKGQFRGVCMSTALTLNEETQSYELGQTDLCTFTIDEMQDISIDSIIIDERDIKIGAETTFDVYVTNNGSETVKNITFTVTDGLGFTKTFTNGINLVSGDCQQVTLTYTAPDNYSKTNLTVLVECSDITDENNSNNSMSVEIGSPKLISHEAEVYVLGSDYVITAWITNESDLAATNVDVLMSFDSDYSKAIAETMTISSLGARKSTLVEFVIPRENVDFDENGVTQVYIAAEINEQRSNNVCYILEQNNTVCEHPVTEEFTVDSSCNEVGHHSVVCRGCGETIRSTEIPKNEHNYENGVCVVCGEVAVISKYNDSTTVIDYVNRFIYGIASGLDINTVFSEYAIHSDQVYYHYDGNKVGTDAKVSIYDNDTDELIGEYTFIIFGDVNGDSWYDGQDAIIVDCLANGMLTKDDVSEAVYMAADCNHDGVIDGLDVALLNEAGTLLANVDQSKPAEVLLETSSEYVEYISLIDQSFEIDEETEDTPEADAEETPETDVESENTTPEQDAKIDIFKMIMNFIRSIFEMLLSYIPMPLK